MSAAYFEDHPTDPDKVILRKRPCPYCNDTPRTWVGLTAEEKSGQRPFGNGLLFNSAEAQVWELAVDYAEAKLKEKNT